MTDVVIIAVLSGLLVHCIDFLIQWRRVALIERYGNRALVPGVFVGLLLRLANVYLAVQFGTKLFTGNNFNAYIITLLMLPLSSLMGAAFLRRKGKAEDAHIQ